MNDSSFAAVSTGDGLRRVFYQDNSGGIRQSIYNNVTQAWKAAIIVGNITDAKPNTPLSAIVWGADSSDSYAVGFLFGLESDPG